MKRKYFMLIMLASLASCSNNKKAANNSADSGNVHKLWKFDTVRSANKNMGAVWVGRNVLDLTKPDTLRFSYKSNKAMPTSYLYKISHDTIFVSNSPAYKILKLNSKELELYAIFNGKKSSDKDSIIMVYKVK
jgi:hypothetical protein